MFPKYYDPHFKPDRTPSRYASDLRKDAIEKANTAVFIEEFLANWVRTERTPETAFAAMKAMRLEAKRLLGHRKTAKANAGKKSPKRGMNAVDPDRPRRPGSGRVVRIDLNGDVTTTYKKTVPGSRPWLEHHGSLKYLELSDEELLLSYGEISDKIDRWRAERAATRNDKRKRVLAGQVQIQIEKRNDVLKVIRHRAMSSERTQRLGAA